MIIKQCYIENFGKFSKKTIDFEQQLSSFNEENGWGKTTLASFIKAMFYGMEDKVGRSKEFIEREKYFPWQGGTFGGSLVFSQGDDEYKISRTFEKKQKDDTFELYDIKSGKKSDKYSKDIGQEIFNINLDTFERSVFITLDDDKKPQGTVDITAKLNNLVEDKGDVSNFDKAKDVLDKAKKQLKADKGPNGKINELSQNITYDDNKLIAIAEKEKVVKQLEKDVEVIKDDISKKNKSIDQLQKEFSISAKFKDKEKYLLLKKQQKENIDSQKQIQDFFNNKIPEEETLEAISSKLNEYKNYNALLKENLVTEIDRNKFKEISSFFKGDVPTTESINSCQEDFNNYNSLLQEKNKYKLSDDEQKEYSELKTKLAGKRITQEMLDKYLSDYEKVQNLKNDVATLNTNKKSADVALENAKSIKTKNLVRTLFFMFTGIFTMAGVLSFLCIKTPLFNKLSGLVVAICFGVLALISLVIAIVKKSPKKDFSKEEKVIDDYKNQINEKTNEYNNLENDYLNFIFEITGQKNNVSVTVLLSDIKNSFSRYLILKNKEQKYEQWLSSKTVKPEDYEKKILSFEMRYNQKQDVALISSILEVLRDKVLKLNELENRINNFDKNEKYFKSSEAQLSEYLKVYNTNKTQSMEKQIQNCLEQKRDFTKLKEEANPIQEEITKFEKENDVSELEKISKPEKTTEELQEQINIIRSELDISTSEKTKKEQAIENNICEIDTKEFLKSEKEQKKIELEESKTTYEMLKNTIKYLTAAKDSLEKKYMDPMKKNFEKYITLLDDKLSFNIDTSLNVSVDTKLKSYSSDYLSNGYKDLVNFCARMALVDSLFKTEKPAVILDDPFVNLDGEKITKALDLVKNISKEKQVVYFACHESRKI